MKSIFDPHSPGHDGAVIIKNDQIARFAAHLPLSKDFQQRGMPRYAAQRRARFGRVERRDVHRRFRRARQKYPSRATAGCAKSTTCRNWDRYSKVFARKIPAAGNPRFFVFLVVQEHWFTKVVTFCLAIGLWYVLVPGSSTVEAVYKVPVLVENLPPNLRVDDIQPAARTPPLPAPNEHFIFSIPANSG